ncbi:MAG TPA: hypothetical protein VLI92_04710 [Candidatus Saccharimonadales bacterium]|nr:hypothetical protein [Candidatus Saccharimonadales bacterium]
MLSHYTVTSLIHAKELKAVSLIAAIPNENEHTLYFFYRKEKVVLPITVTYSNSTYLDFIVESFRSLEINVTQIIIAEEANLLKATLKIVSSTATRHITLNLNDGICLAAKCNAEVLVSADFLDKYGIKVTKELLERSISDI